MYLLSSRVVLNIFRQEYLPRKSQIIYTDGFFAWNLSCIEWSSLHWMSCRNLLQQNRFELGLISTCLALMLISPKHQLNSLWRCVVSFAASFFQRQKTSYNLAIIIPNFDLHGDGLACFPINCKWKTGLFCPSGAVGVYAAFRTGVYAGPIIEVRRGSDSVTMDFYADSSGQFGTAVNGKGSRLSSWLNGSVGYVSKWYDQSGLGNNASQTNPSVQPAIDVVNKRVDFTVSGGQAFFNLPTGTVPQRIQFTITARHNNINNPTGGLLGGGAPSSSECSNFRRDSSGYLNYWWGNDFPGGVYAPQNTVTFKFDGATEFLYINGSQAASAPRSGWNGQHGNEFLGQTMEAEKLNGELYFLQIFTVALSDSDRAIVESGMKDCNLDSITSTMCTTCPPGTYGSASGILQGLHFQVQGGNNFIALT